VRPAARWRWHALHRALADLLEFLPKLVSGLLIFLFFWISGKAAARVISNLRRLRHVAPELALLLARTVQLSLLAFGVITALDTIGIHVTMLVAGLGLTGFAVGFALKDVISNALSGMLIIIFRPFKNGDRISVFSSIPFEGIVTDINLRYTVLDSDERTVFIPNSILSTNAVIVSKPKQPVDGPPASTSG
jgi:small-conductance mechanosensitive channel